MPRRNRRPGDGEAVPLRPGPGPHIEVRRGREWNVQAIAASAAVKVYRCPGCSLEIDAGVAHLVVWRADGVLGDAADLGARRHWHPHCWRVT